MHLKDREKEGAGARYLSSDVHLSALSLDEELVKTGLLMVDMYNLFKSINVLIIIVLKMMIKSNSPFPFYAIVVKIGMTIISREVLNGVNVLQKFDLDQY